MKHSFVLFIIIATSVLVFNSCKKQPDFSNVPQISFETMKQYRTTGSNPEDSILITLSFQDGDGDLGLGQGDTLSPYNLYNITTDSAGNPIKYGSKPGMPPYNQNDQCNPYHIYYDTTTKVNDTLLVSINPHYFNYHVVFLKKVGSNYDTISSCPILNFCGRFPVLSPTNYSGALQGDLTITLYSDFSDPNPIAPEFDLKGQTVKFRIYIEDRALHQSNIIETTDISF